MPMSHNVGSFTGDKVGYKNPLTMIWTKTWEKFVMNKHSEIQRNGLSVSNFMKEHSLYGIMNE